MLRCVVLALTASAASAHDPYEITTRAFRYSNHLELHIDMEFSAAMLLAGQPGWRTNHLTAAEQLAVAYPALASRAAAFLQVSTNQAPLPVLSTNIALGVEDHVSFILWLPAAPGRLSLAIGELKRLSDYGPYGTSLTVLDMGQRRVLGQAVLFGDSPPLQVEAADLEPAPLAAAPARAIHVPEAALADAARPGSPGPVPRGWRVWLLVLVAAVLLLGVVVRRRR